MVKKSVEDRLEELEAFKSRVELGSKWLRCLFYVVGGFIVTLGVISTIVKDWFFK